MQEPNRNYDEAWEDIVRRLGGTNEQAASASASQEAAPATNGPRDYSPVPEVIEDFQPPEPQPILTGSPRLVLSWAAVLGAIALWVLTALLSWQLPWWLTTVSTVGFLSGATSLFLLLPKTRTLRDPYDDDDYGAGAKV